MSNREKVMSWLEGLAEPDWRDFHSDSEVQNIAKSALELLKAQRETIDELISTDKALKLLEEQEETELCDRCGRRRLKSNREGGNNER